MTPTVSLIMPTWRGDDALELEAAIDSVLCQSLSEIELLVVADGPLGAESERVLEERRLIDPRLRRLTLPESRGPAAARNVGIEAAAGEYIAMLDADDLAMPERLERQLEFLREHDAEVVGSFYRLVGSDGQVCGERRLPVDTARIRRTIALVNPIGSSMLFARADVLKATRYDESIRYGEDYDLSIRLLRGGHSLMNLPEFLVDVRTGASFLARRRGWVTFRSDCVNRLRGLMLAPVWLRPMLLVPVSALLVARLFPASFLKPLYAVRGRLGFGS